MADDCQAHSMQTAYTLSSSVSSPKLEETHHSGYHSRRTCSLYARTNMPPSAKALDIDNNISTISSSWSGMQYGQQLGKSLHEPSSPSCQPSMKLYNCSMAYPSIPLFPYPGWFDPLFGGVASGQVDHTNAYTEAVWRLVSHDVLASDDVAVPERREYREDLTGVHNGGNAGPHQDASITQNFQSTRAKTIGLSLPDSFAPGNILSSALNPDHAECHQGSNFASLKTASSHIQQELPPSDARDTLDNASPPQYPSLPRLDTTINIESDAFGQLFDTTVPCWQYEFSNEWASQAQHGFDPVLQPVSSIGEDEMPTRVQKVRRETKAVPKHPGHRRDRSGDEFLLECKAKGMSYRDIKIEGGFMEAESTLRGRYRTLTKPKEARVRKPEWTPLDVSILKETVAQFGNSAGISGYSAYHGKRAQRHIMNKIPWKQVADVMAHRGCYRFGNATVKKKYIEVLGW